jgi:hypothetical protein
VIHEGVSKSFRTESITKYTLTTINTRREATQMVMAPKLTRLTYKIAIQLHQLHLVAESCTIYSSRSRWPVRKLLNTPSHTVFTKRPDSSVGIVLGYGLNDRGSRVRFPAGAGNFSLHHRVQNGSGDHPASYSMGTRGSFPGGKAAGT